MFPRDPRKKGQRFFPGFRLVQNAMTAQASLVRQKNGAEMTSG
jgi:hypothetical protein